MYSHYQAFRKYFSCVLDLNLTSNDKRRMLCNQIFKMSTPHFLQYNESRKCFKKDETFLIRHLCNSTLRK